MRYEYFKSEPELFQQCCTGWWQVVHAWTIIPLDDFPLHFQLSHGMIFLRHKLYRSFDRCAIFTLVKMHARFRIPIEGVEVCVAAIRATAFFGA